MKRIIFLPIIFLSCFLNSNAQVYHPFPDTLAKWSEGYGGCMDCTPGNWGMCSDGGYIYDEANDTFLNGFRYTLIGFQNTWGYVTTTNSGNTIIISQSNSPINPPGQIIGAIREDSTKKVWYRKFVSGVYEMAGSIIDTLTDTTDFLIYDFGIQVGDTLHWTLYNSVLQNIDSIQLENGEYRRVYNFQNSGFWTSSTYWIEGIGAENGLFGAYDYMGECSGSHLNCFSVDDTFFIGGGFSCDSIHVVGVNEIPDNSGIFIFPQPANDFINIQTENNAEKEIEFYNLLGQSVFKMPMKEKNLKINTSVIGNSGFYLCKITNRDGTSFIRKIIIQ